MQGQQIITKRQRQKRQVFKPFALSALSLMEKGGCDANSIDPKTVWRPTNEEHVWRTRLF